eukprot:GILI01017069.1.p1 GENE.GILI01017069.1~~GILI01017069.1.p1  ORF type:complete len:272 (-),score=14.09 GILI01017069.1:205-1020(-)
MGQTTSSNAVQSQKQEKKEQLRMEEVHRQQQAANELRSKSRAEIARLRMAVEGLQEQRTAVASDIRLMAPAAAFLTRPILAVSLAIPGLILGSIGVYRHLMWAIYPNIALAIIASLIRLAKGKSACLKFIEVMLLCQCFLVTIVSPLPTLLSMGSFWILLQFSDVSKDFDIDKTSRSTKKKEKANHLDDLKFSNVDRMLIGGVGKPAGDGDLVCNICLSNIPDVAFIPCGHVRCCVTCVRELCVRETASKSQKCPECRADIDQVFYPARGS